MTCQENELCQYFTYHETDQACSLTTECTYYDFTCDECVYGQKICNSTVGAPSSFEYFDL